MHPNRERFHIVKDIINSGDVDEYLEDIKAACAERKKQNEWEDKQDR